MERVLIVDDDAKLLRMLQRTLVYEGFDVTTAADGEEALNAVYDRRPSLLILDWMMPHMDGMETLRALRGQENDIPVLMLTARDAVEDRVEGLEEGADDYLVKPFAPTELVARVRALLRRTVGNADAATFADLRLDLETRQGWRGERRFDLTATEYELLRLFLRHPEQALSRSQILTHVWGADFYGNENILDVYVGYVRKKTEAGGEPRLIQTLRGVGYVLREES